MCVSVCVRVHACACVSAEEGVETSGQLVEVSLQYVSFTRSYADDTDNRVSSLHQPNLHTSCSYHRTFVNEYT